MCKRRATKFSLILAALFCWSQVQAVPVSSALQQAIHKNSEAAFIVYFTDHVDLSQFHPQGSGRGIERAAMIRALQSQAQASQQQAVALLKNTGAKRIAQLWMINALAVQAKGHVIPQLAKLPGVARIDVDTTLQAPVSKSGTASSTVEWNLNTLRVPEYWGQGYLGVGVVVATMDTGVDVDHPDLASRWRDGSNSWFDPNGEHPTPYDYSGHGTQVMGLAVGGNASGSSIGVAPGAQWIAVKIYNDAGLASLSAIHQGFQWLLDPDQNPNSDDSPDVINNSWGFSSLAGQCYTEFALDIEVLKIADIGVVFSAGNLGPGSYSSVSPANNPEGYAVGMIDDQWNLAASSSRGPSACGNTLYPEVVAPGVNVKTSDLTFGGLFPDSYVYMVGTSAAAPHVAGAMALLRQAFPNALITDLEKALENSALDLGTAGPDNDYGYGLVDIVAAAEWLSAQNPPPPQPSCTDSDGDAFFAEAECGTLVDCDDNNAAINPDACDIKGDGIDQNCDGVDRLKGKSCPVLDTGGGSTEGNGSTCSDGVDNDKDGLIDCADPGCSKNRMCRI